MRPSAPRALTRALVLALLVVAACGGDDSPTSSPEPTSTTVPSTTVPGGATSTSTTPSPVDLDAVSIGLTEVGEADQPVALAVRPGHAPLYVAEKEGRVSVLDGQAEPLLDITGEVSSDGERGLLGIVFYPDGVYLYVSFTDVDGDSRLIELAMGEGPRSIDLASRRQVLAVDQPASNHNGGTITFGPDGILWFGLGDGGGSGDRFGNAQNKGTLLGGILRIDPRPSGGAPYAAPADNPFRAPGERPELAIYGLRNPWRFTFDRATGDLWIGDVGQNELEEIDLLSRGSILGANLGWPYREATRPFDGRTPPPEVVNPVWEYGRDEGRSVVGGYVYRGQRVPALVGVYLFSDTYEPTIRLLAVDDTGVRHRDTGLDVPGGNAVAFGEDAAGELYVLSLSGGIYRIDPA